MWTIPLLFLSFLTVTRVASLRIIRQEVVAAEDAGAKNATLPPDTLKLNFSDPSLQESEASNQALLNLTTPTRKNYLLSAIQSIPDDPDHQPINDVQKTALQKYWKLTVAAYSFWLKPGPFKCFFYCPDFKETVIIDRFIAQPLGVKGYIARDDKRGVIWISFRGIFSPQQAMAAATWVPIPFGRKAFGSLVHSGAYFTWLNAKDTVLKALKDQMSKYPDYDIEILGHSLGAATGTICAASLIDNNVVKPEKIFLIAFGGPRVGNYVFANHYGKAFFSKRIVNKRDPIPHAAPMILFKHFPHEIFVSPSGKIIQCKDGEDWKCSKGLPPLLYNPMDHFGFLGVNIVLNVAETFRLYPGLQEAADAVKGMFDSKNPSSLRRLFFGS
ncbi:uncharacterized protein VTP21DRAFT_11205 [Calcarisporiella thermophila]|uniref:uncharacterized protein n=1 Tax=Calcarisporiella thermophila TaxID=911321 RepID=UPI003741EE35